jgi:hypothetical protein
MMREHVNVPRLLELSMRAISSRDGSLQEHATDFYTDPYITPEQTGVDIGFAVTLFSPQLKKSEFTLITSTSSSQLGPIHSLLSK